MEVSTFALSWTPVLLLTFVAVGLKRPALELSLIGVGFTAGLAYVGFRTPLGVIWLAALDGVLTTLPLLLVVLAGILLSNLLRATGGIERIVTWFASGLRHPEHRHLFISLGTANFLEGASIIAEPLVAPMLRAAGVSPPGAAALSIIGYAGLMGVEMAGIIITVLALITGLPPAELASATAWLSVPATLAMAACIPWYLPRGEGGLRGLALMLAGGLLVSLVALAATVTLGVALAGMAGGLALMAALMLLGARRWQWSREIRRDLFPFVVILVPLLLVNTAPELRELTSERLVLHLEVVPGHRITLTPFFSAYLYLFMACGTAAAMFGRKVQMAPVLAVSLRQGWRALMGMALFGAMGQIIAYSGYAQGFGQVDQSRNIPWVLAMGLKTYTGSWYPLFVPLLGWAGTFLTGYGVASLMLFGELQVRAAGLLQVSAVWLAAGLTVGASVGSISSPFKIALAAPMCGALGQEGTILRRTIPLGVAASLIIGVILWAIC
ncbi:MAG: L-lactate permease [Deltaproteobacteria bacterium]|nr:L-lactate permease [Deltaproteobacteria bacterium]